MLNYEIRILNAQQRPSVIFQAFYVDDNDAIEIAVKLSGGRAVEIWRDLECIYHIPPREVSGDKAA